MAKPESVFVYIGTYPDVAEARDDYRVVKDLHSAGAMPGQAALVIVGESKVEQALDKAALKAEKHVARELHVSPRDIDQAVQEAAGDVR